MFVARLGTQLGIEARQVALFHRNADNKLLKSIGGVASRTPPRPRAHRSRSPRGPRRGADRVRSWRSCDSPSPRSTPPSATSPATPRWSRPWAAQGRRGRRPPGRLPRDGADRLPRRGPGPAHVVRRRVPGGARPGSPPTSPPTGSATCRSSSATSTAPGSAAPSTPTRAGSCRRTAPPCCTAAASSPATSSTTCPTTASSTRARYFAPGARPDRGALRGVDVALTICEDLWQDGGPFAVAARGRRRAGGGHQRLAVRAGQGRRPAAARGPARGRGRVHPGLREHGRRPGRAGLRRRLDGRGRRRRACWPAARSSPRTCWCSTSTSPSRRPTAGRRRRAGVVRTSVSERAGARAYAAAAAPPEAPRLDRRCGEV